MTADTFFLDTNVLVDASDTARPDHKKAVRLIETGQRLVFSAQVIREYLVVATRPVRVNGLGMKVPQALANLASFRGFVATLPEERPLLPQFLELVEAVACRGRTLHDAHIAATMLAHSVKTLVSANAADFKRFPGIDVIDIGTAHGLARRN